MKTVLVFGTFDALHSGHRYFLKQDKKWAGRLVVSLVRNEFVRFFKGKIPEHDESERTVRLNDTCLVEEVHLRDPIAGSYDLMLKVEKGC